MQKLFLLLLISSYSYSQNIDNLLIKINEINASSFIGYDNFEALYYLNNNVLFKKTNTKTISYSNLHLGKITQVDITNPLKIIVFYKDFNSIVFLDNKLNELTNSINLDAILFKKIHYVGTANNSKLWLVSKDDNSLILFNLLSKKTEFIKQLPNTFNFINAFSNYQNIWLNSRSKILKYNVYGSFIEQYSIKNIEKLTAYKNTIIYKYNKNLYYLIKGYNPKLITKNVNLKIKDFYINNHANYFFDGKYIYKQDFIKK